MIRILLVDDQALLCEVLKTWLEVEEDLEVIGVANNGKEALSKIENLKPDIVLMDIDMPEMDGLSATQIVTEQFPDTKVIFLSAHDEDDYLGRSLRAGAKGYLLKNTTAEELAEKVRYVHNNSNLEEGESNDNAIAIQTQLEDLISTYRHKFQKQLEEQRKLLNDSNPSSDLLATYEEKFQEMEKELLIKHEGKLEELKQESESNWESIRKEILTVHSKVNNANSSLSSKVNQQMVNLKKDFDEELASALDNWSRERSALQEWAVQRDEIKPSIDELDNKYRNELVSLVNSMRASFRDMDREIKTMRNWLIGTLSVSILSLGISGWILGSNFTSNNNTNSNIEQSN